MPCTMPGPGDLRSHHVFLHHAFMMHPNSSLTILTETWVEWDENIISITSRVTVPLV